MTTTPPEVTRTIVESMLEDVPQLAEPLGVGAASLTAAFSDFRATSIGRWRTDLSAEQLADVEAEAGSLLASLGYT